MITNCGVLTPRWYDINCETRPSLTQNHIPYFHSMLCKWAYNISLSFFWVVVISAQQKPHLMKSILSVSRLDPSKYGKWEIKNKHLKALFNEQTQDTIGCIFADEIRIPGESVGVGRVGSDSRGGYLNGPITEKRNDLGNLEIGFRETNLSFTDFIIRPWTIITGYKGLIADDGGLTSPSGASYWGGSIKSNIHVYQLAKGGTTECSQSVVRKEFHFYDAVPISVSDDDLKSEDQGLNKRQTSFAYSYYSVGPGNA